MVHMLPSAPISRRRVVGVGVLSLAGAVLAACGSPAPPTPAPTAAPAAKPADAPKPATEATKPAAAAAAPKPGTKTGTIGYWNDYGGANGKAMDALLDQFQKETGNKIEQQRMGAVDINAKIRVTNQAGENPDLLMLNSFAIPVNARDNLLEELDDKLLADRGYKADDFSDVAWKAAIYKGKRYGVPLDAVMSVMFLNDKVFKDAGLAGPDGKPKIPTNREETMSMAKQMTKGDVFGFSIGAPNGYTALEQFLYQNDANVFTQDFAKSGLADPAALEVADWLGSIYAKDKVAPPIGVDHLKAFITGKIGIWIAGSWNASGLDEAKMDYTPAHVPALFKKPKVWAVAHNYTFPVQKTKDDTKREIAWQQVRWFIDHADVWTLEGGVLGATKKAQSDPKVLANKNFKVMVAQAPDWQFSQPTPKWSEWQGKSPPVLEAIYAGTTPARDALTKFSKDVDSIPD
jgi:multiple sugar transport system substrate-binding protein